MQTMPPSACAFRSLNPLDTPLKTLKANKASPPSGSYPISMTNLRPIQPLHRRSLPMETCTRLQRAIQDLLDGRGPLHSFPCFRDEAGNLIAVAVIDVLQRHGLSAFTFFDPISQNGSGSLSHPGSSARSRAFTAPFIHQATGFKPAKR